VSANPIALSIVAAISSVLGVLIHQFSAPNSQDKFKVFDSGFLTGCLLAVITAVIFFNIFEYTTFKEKLGKDITWRAAVLVGALCGLLNEKILAAILAFAGK
jgi:small basic protein